MRFQSELLLDAGDMSQASLTSEIFDLKQMAIATIQAVYTGSPTGSLQLQVSCEAQSPSVWSDFDSALAISAAGNHTFNITATGFLYLKAVYTKSGGSGSLSIRASAKG